MWERKKKYGDQIFEVSYASTEASKKKRNSMGINEDLNSRKFICSFFFESQQYFNEYWCS